MAVKLGPLESRTNDAEHQPERNFLEKLLFMVLWTTNLMTEDLKIRPTAEYLYITIQTKLAIAYRSNRTFQNTKAYAALLPQRETFKRKTTSVRMAEVASYW